MVVIFESLVLFSFFRRPSWDGTRVLYLEERKRGVGPLERPF